VPTELHLRFRRPFDVLDEAVALKVEPERMERMGATLVNHVSGPNDADDRASLRVEPHRRAYGGSIYEKTSWLNSIQEVPLETIQSLVELRKWCVPDEADC
jgi:hypothetical protein